MNENFRIKEIKKSYISTSVAMIQTYYIIQKRIKKMFSKEYKWVNFKVATMYGCDRHYEEVVFTNLNKAKQYLKELKEIYKED